MLYLKKIVGRANEVALKDITPPKTDLRPGDEVVGILPDDLKKLYHLWCIVGERAATLTKAAQERFEGLPKEEIARRKDEIHHAHQQYFLVALEEKMLEECFWTSVRVAFPAIATKQMISLRKDWQVAVVDLVQDAKRKAFELLETMFENPNMFEDSDD